MPAHESLLTDEELPEKSPDSMNSRKRSRRREAHPDRPAKSQASTADVFFRLLVPSNMIGKVIGKQGMRIKQLREETGARIKIADPLTHVEERVILISSKDETLEPQCVAEQALIRLANLVLEPETRDRVNAAAVGLHHPEGPIVTRLLITGSQAGGVIGKAGATIKEIRKSSGANVRVLTSDHFSMCASACKTDRLVQMYGEIPQVQRALELIAAKLRKNPPNEVVSVNVKHRSIGNTTPPIILPTFADLVGNDLTSVHSTSGFVGQMQKVSLELNVSTDLIGGIIGKGGSNITRIRKLSGALIKVCEQEDGALERAILVEGTSLQVMKAQNLVEECLAKKQ